MGEIRKSIRRHLDALNGIQAATMLLLSHPATFFLKEEFRQTEAALRQLTRIMITDQRDTFFADFRQEDLPSPFRKGAGIHLGPRLLLGMLLGLRLMDRPLGLRLWLWRLRLCPSLIGLGGVLILVPLLLPAALALAFGGPSLGGT